MYMVLSLVEFFALQVLVSKDYKLIHTYMAKGVKIDLNIFTPLAIYVCGRLILL